MKNNKKNAILIIAVVLVIGLVVNTTRVMSHAYFKTTKSFNVIQGKIPAKAKGDVGIAVLIDGEKSNTIPEKDSGYHFVGSECNNEANATWNEISWNVSVNNLKKSGTVCELKFESGDLTFNYGDGSLNTVARNCTVTNKNCDSLNGVGGYINNLAIYDTLIGRDLDASETSNYLETYSGNYHDLNKLKGSKISATPELLTSEERQNTIMFNKGENVIYLNNTVKGDNNSIIKIDLAWSNAGDYKEFDNLQLMLDNSYYTLKEAVNNKKIKPIVIMGDSSVNSSLKHLNHNPTNIYDGGKISGVYSHILIYFMLEENVVFARYKINSPGQCFYFIGGQSANIIKDKVMHLK